MMPKNNAAAEIVRLCRRASNGLCYSEETFMKDLRQLAWLLPGITTCQVCRCQEAKHDEETKFGLRLQICGACHVRFAKTEVIA